jgi:hypothetical protein
VRALQPSAGNRLKKEQVLGFLNNLWGLRTELSYRPARLHSLAVGGIGVLRNRFLDFLKVYNFGLSRVSLDVGIRNGGQTSRDTGQEKIGCGN